jgi:hypothetical protein
MAIACSYFNFDKKDISNGEWGRATWSKVVRFTNSDTQTEEWIYYIDFREGKRKITHKKGFRKEKTKKWGGIGKKEGQIGGKKKKGEESPHVCLIDLERITPSRHLKKTIYNKARKAKEVDFEDNDAIKKYMSYIFEHSYSDIKILTESGDNQIFKYGNSANQNYSSFNTASGEDAITNLLTQILYMPEKSLILIDEIEVGLHPRIQRRLMDVIYHISLKQKKQFIITSHSYAIIDSVPQEARIFIDTSSDKSICRSALTTYETLTRMDSETFPVSSLFVEDDVSESIVKKAISELNDEDPGFVRLIKVLPIGPANETFNYFKKRKEIKEPFLPKPACILDGDMREEYKDKDEEFLFFHYSEEAPEKMLLRSYLDKYNNDTLKYHLENSDPHCLFQKMVETGISANKKEAFEKCFEAYRNSEDGGKHFDELKDFLKKLKL